MIKDRKFASNITDMGVLSRKLMMAFVVVVVLFCLLLFFVGGGGGGLCVCLIHS